VNGFDLIRAVAAYDRTARTLYLGARAVGNIGDSDGDGTANAGVACSPPLNPGEQRIQDPAGVGFLESYSWGIDTNCDGKNEIVIRTAVVAGVLRLDVLGGAAGATAVAFNGSDIEGSVQNIDLPLVFAVSAFAGSTTDGLSEDATNSVHCAPNLGIKITKVAEPQAVCPGGTTRFNISVRNTGAAPLTTTLTDQLPPQLAYDNDLSGDFTFASAVAGLISFNPLVIPAGEVRTASFRVRASADCFGAVTNTAMVVGSFTSPCIEGGEPQLVQDQAAAVVTCVARPCVTARCETSVSEASPGDIVAVSGIATNCSPTVSDIVVTIAGGSHAFGDVAAGAEARFDTTLVMPQC